MKKSMLLLLSLLLLIPGIIGCTQDNRDFAKYEMGEIVEVEGWDLTINDFEFIDDFEEDFSPVVMEDDEIFLKVYLTIKRTGKEGVNFLYQLGRIEIKAMYDNEYLYSSTSSFADGDLSDTRVEPLMGKDGYIYFTLPKDLVDKDGSIDLLIRTGDIIDLEKSGETEETKVNLR